MHSSRFAVGCVLVISLASCADATAPVALEPRTQVSLSQRMSAQSVPFDHLVFNSCNSELVELTGRLHLAWRWSEDGFASQANYQGVSGRGLRTGAIYRATAMDHYRSDGPETSQIFWKGHFMLIGQGNGPKLQVTVMYTFDVLPNGEIRPGGHDVITTRCHY
jgi:hypothetical protein